MTIENVAELGQRQGEGQVNGQGKGQGEGEGQGFKVLTKGASSHLPPIVQIKDSTTNDTQHNISNIVKKTEGGDLDSKAGIGGNETLGGGVLDDHVCDDDDLTDFLSEESEVPTVQGQGQGQDQELGEMDERKGNGKGNNSLSDTGDTVSHRKIGADGSNNVTSILSEVSEEKVEAVGEAPLEPVLTQAVHAAGGKGGGGGLRKITKKKVNTAPVPDPELQPLPLPLSLPLPLPLPSTTSFTTIASPQSNLNVDECGGGRADGNEDGETAEKEKEKKKVLAVGADLDLPSLSVTDDSGDEEVSKSSDRNNDDNAVAHGDGDNNGGGGISAVPVIESTAIPVPDNDNADHNIAIDVSEIKYAEKSNNDAQDVEVEGEGDGEGEKVEAVKMQFNSLVNKNDRAINCDLPLRVSALAGDTDNDNGRSISGEEQKEVNDNSVVAIDANKDGAGRRGDEEDGGNYSSPGTQTILPFKTEAIAPLRDNEVETDSAEIEDEGRDEDEAVAGDVNDVRERRSTGQSERQIKEQMLGQDQEEVDDVVTTEETVSNNVYKGTLYMNTEETSRALDYGDEIEIEDEDDEEGVEISHDATPEHPTRTCFGAGAEGDVISNSDDLCSMQVDSMVIADEDEVQEEKETAMGLHPYRKEDEKSLIIEFIASEVGEASVTLDKRSNNSSDLDCVKSMGNSSCICSEDKDEDKDKDNDDEDGVDDGRQNRDDSHVKEEVDVLEVSIPAVKSSDLPLLSSGLRDGERSEANDDIGNSNHNEHGIYKKHDGDDDDDDEAFYEDYKDEEEEEEGQVEKEVNEAISSLTGIHHNDEVISPQFIGSGNRIEWGRDEMEQESEDDLHQRPPSTVHAQLSDSDRTYSETPCPRNGHVGVSTNNSGSSDSSSSSSSDSNSYTAAPTSLSATDDMKDGNIKSKKEYEGADSNIGSIPVRVTLEAAQTSPSVSKAMAIDGSILPYDFPLNSRTAATANGQCGDGADSRITRTNNFDGKSSNHSSSGAGVLGLRGGGSSTDRIDSAEHSTTAVSAAAMLAIKQALLDAAKWGLEEQEQEQGHGHGRVLDGGDSEEEEERKRRKEKRKLKKKEDEERGIYRGSSGKDADIEDEDFTRGLHKKKKKDKDKEKKSSSKAKDRDKDRVDEGGQQREKRKKDKKSISSSVKKVIDTLSESHDEEGGLEDLEDDLDF